MTVTMVCPALLVPGYEETGPNFLGTLRWIAQTVHANWGKVEKVQTAFGEHGITYTEAEDSEEPEEGDYALIGFVLPDEFYVEIETGTYGQLEGLRIYRNDGNATARTADV